MAFLKQLTRATKLSCIAVLCWQLGVFAAPRQAFSQEAKSPTPVHAIAMHGDAKYKPDFKQFDYVNADAPKGGVMRLGGFGSFDSLNGFIVKGESADGLGMLYDSLTTPSADEPFTHYGLLAESFEIPEDRSWAIFNMRPEARWHDGQPITADDVVWTFEALMRDGAPGYRYYYAGVERVEKLDRYRVKFVFKSSENREMPLIVGEMAILPKHYWQQHEFAKTTLEPPLGSGPYRIEKVDAGRSIVYARVDDYWARDLPVKKGRHNIDTIRYDYYRDSAVQVEAFKAGALDVRAENTSKLWATAYDIPALEKGLIVKQEFAHHRPQGMQGFAYNIRRDLFKDARVRAALAYGFDFEWSNRNLFYDQYTRTRSYFDNSELAATDLPTADELAILEKYRGRIPDEVFTQTYMPPGTRGDGRIRDNLRAADKLLREAGWEIQGKDRVHTKTGQRFEFEILLAQPAFERVVLPFAKNLERLGIRAKVRTVDTAQYLKRMETFDFDMMVSSWGQSFSPGNEQRGYWGSDAAARPGSRNLVGISDPVIDELVEGVISAPDRKSLITRTRALDRVLQWGHYVIPHWHITTDRIAYWNKYAMPEIIPMNGVQTDTWWYDENAAERTTGALQSLKGN